MRFVTTHYAGNIQILTRSEVFMTEEATLDGTRSTYSPDLLTSCFLGSTVLHRTQIRDKPMWNYRAFLETYKRLNKWLVFHWSSIKGFAFRNEITSVMNMFLLSWHLILCLYITSNLLTVRNTYGNGNRRHRNRVRWRDSIWYLPLSWNGINIPIKRPFPVKCFTARIPTNYI